MKVFSLCSDSRETRTALTVSFRLERGGQFESGFQDIGLTNFKPAGWTFPIIIPAYGTMILAQTSAWDFESSNVNTGCTPDGKIPVVHVSVGSSPVRNFIDKTQVLNTGGYDKSGSGCGGYAEGHPFVALKTKDGSDD